jgi:L-amino acid N-acyltransferase
MIVRDAAPADVPGILEIYNDVVATSTAIYAFDPSTLDERVRWFESRRAQGYPVLVAADGPSILGFASFGDFRPFPGYVTTVEHSVHVRTDRRRGGLGRALVESLLPRARALGKHVSVGAIDAENEPSLRLHQKLGFREVARMPEVARKFDRWLELVLVQKLL